MEEKPKDFWDRWQSVVVICSIIAGFLIQGAVYFKDSGARDAKLDFLVNQVAEFAATRYTKDDGVKDQAINNAHYTDLSERMKQLEWRANRAEQAGFSRQPYVDHRPVPQPVQPSPMPKLVP